MFNASHRDSKDLVSVTNPSAGVFCLSLAAGITAGTTFPELTPDSQNDGTNVTDDTYVHLEDESAAPDCPVGTFEVVSFFVRSNSIVQTNEPFFFAVP